MPLTHIKNSSITPSNEFNLSLKMTNHSKLMQIYLGASTLKKPALFSDQLQPVRNRTKLSDFIDWK